MDTLTFIAEIVKAVAWPATALALVLLFRSPLTRLIEGIRLKKLKYGDWEAQFDRYKLDVEKHIHVGRRALAQQDLIAGTLESVRLSPRAHPEEPTTSAIESIVSAWSELEEAVAELASQANVSGPPSGIPRELVKQGIIKAETANALEGLRHMRNLALHAPGGEPPEGRAREFVTLAQALRWGIDDEARRAAQAKDER
jgi:hypothetical protein